MQTGLRLVCACGAAALLVVGCGESNPGPYPAPPNGLQTVVEANDKATFPSTPPDTDPFSPALEMMVTKSMLYAAAIKHGVNLGLAWHESGWNAAASSGPARLNRKVNLFDPADNMEMATAILRSNLERWHNDLAKALVAYYAGGGAVREWNELTRDEQRYVWAVYRAALLFKEGRGPV